MTNKVHKLVLLDNISIDGYILCNFSVICCSKLISYFVCYHTVVKYSLKQREGFHSSWTSERYAIDRHLNIEFDLLLGVRRASFVRVISASAHQSRLLVWDTETFDVQIPRYFMDHTWMEMQIRRDCKTFKRKNQFRVVIYYWNAAD